LGGAVGEVKGFCWDVSFPESLLSVSVCTIRIFHRVATYSDPFLAEYVLERAECALVRRPNDAMDAERIGE